MHTQMSASFFHAAQCHRLPCISCLRWAEQSERPRCPLACCMSARALHPTYPAYPTHTTTTTITPLFFPSPDRLRRAHIIPIFLPSFRAGPKDQLATGPNKCPRRSREGGGRVADVACCLEISSSFPSNPVPIASFLFFWPASINLRVFFLQHHSKYASTALRKLVCPSLPSLPSNKLVAQRGMLSLATRHGYEKTVASFLSLSSLPTYASKDSTLETQFPLL